MPVSTHTQSTRHLVNVLPVAIWFIADLLQWRKNWRWKDGTGQISSATYNHLVPNLFTSRQLNVSTSFWPAVWQGTLKHLQQNRKHLQQKKIARRTSIAGVFYGVFVCRERNRFEAEIPQVACSFFFHSKGHPWRSRAANSVFVWRLVLYCKTQPF